MPIGTLRTSGPYDELVTPGQSAETDRALNQPGETAQIIFWDQVPDSTSGNIGFRNVETGETVGTGTYVPARDDGSVSRFVNLPGETGRYEVTVGGEEIDTPWSTFSVEGEQSDDETASRPDHVTPVEEVVAPDDPDPADAPGVVNADNPEGATLAPSLRRSIGNVGGSVTIGGDPLEVGPVTDDDERVADGGGDGSGLLGGIGILAALAAVVWVVMG